MSRTSLGLLALAPWLFCAAVQAQTVVPPVSATPMPGGHGGGDVSAIKQRALSKIQERMSRLQSEQACVSAAQDMNALRACREQAQSSHEKKC